jgi:F-type H+-transporting ATPase subunit delta
MSEYAIARPYAKAMFKIALKDNTLPLWSEILNNLAAAMQEQTIINFMHNPNVTYEQQGALLADIIEQFVGETGKRFIKILAFNRRLNLFSEIAKTYEQLRFEHENTVKVRTIATMPLTAEQQTKLESVLQKRLQKKIILQFEIDEQLLGGMIIRIGDNVIDGSLRNKLNHLKNSLLT